MHESHWTSLCVSCSADGVMSMAPATRVRVHLQYSHGSLFNRNVCLLIPAIDPKENIRQDEGVQQDHCSREDAAGYGRETDPFVRVSIQEGDEDDR